MRRTLSLLLVAALAGVAGAAEAKKIEIPLRFDDYYTYDEVVSALQALHNAYPKLTKLDVVGKSEEGRGIYCMTVNNPDTGEFLDKPGIYVDGNIHGNEIQAGEVALYLLNLLLTEYGRNDEITKLVDTKCFYVVPVVNVDGRYHFFADANSAFFGNRSLRVPRDDDHDGLVDEDPPDDLDGDGNICTMRRRDPFGRFRADPEDPRLMVEVKPGEKGEWTVLGMEGIDNDGDGKFNEDQEGYLDPNRNWGFDWMPDYVQRGAGDYPFQGCGLKALASFIRQRPNICVAWAFHNYGGMVLRGPSTKSQGEYHPKDVAVYDYLGQQSERILPGYRYMISWKDLYQTYGDFIEWMVMVNGAYGFVGELFVTEHETFRTRKEDKVQESKPVPEGKEGQEEYAEYEEGMDRERLKFNDHVALGRLYRPWKPFKHPVYGDIEIGGWVKLSTRIPAPFMLKDLVHRNAAAVIFTAKQTPAVTMDVIGVSSIGKDLYRVRVRLANSGAIPTMSHHASQQKLYPQDVLCAEGKQARVVAGGRIENPDTDEVEYKEYRPELQFLTVPGLGKTEYQFIVSGGGALTISYQSRHGGRIRKTVELK